MNSMETCNEMDRNKLLVRARVRIVFHARIALARYFSLAITGTGETLGEWDVTKSARANLRGLNIWTVDVEVDSMSTIVWNWIILDDSGRLVSQESGHVFRRLDVLCDNMVILVNWNQAMRIRYVAVNLVYKNDGASEEKPTESYGRFKEKEHSQKESDLSLLSIREYDGDDEYSSSSEYGERFESEDGGQGSDCSLFEDEDGGERYNDEEEKNKELEEEEEEEEEKEEEEYDDDESDEREEMEEEEEEEKEVDERSVMEHDEDWMGEEKESFEEMDEENTQEQQDMIKMGKFLVDETQQNIEPTCISFEKVYDNIGGTAKKQKGGLLDTCLKIGAVVAGGLTVAFVMKKMFK